MKRILLIQVNAKTEAERPMDRSDAIPSWAEIFKTVALNPIDVATELSSFISREYWVSLLRYMNATSEQGERQKENVLRFYPVQVDFDQWEVNDPKTWESERARQKKLKEIPTDWSLPAEDVRLVSDAGKTLLEAHPCFATFLWESGGERHPAGPPPKGCDKVDVEPKGDKLAAIGPPSVPALASAPKQAMTSVMLGTDALFEFDKAELRPEGRAGLNALMARIKEIQLETVIVIGHTDRLGTRAYNLALSERRAGAIKNHLVAMGVDVRRIHAEGVGDTQPLTGDRCGVGREKNQALIDCLQPDRRVEIRIVGFR